jgi:ABC-2 type transport system permease protein
MNFCLGNSLEPLLWREARISLLSFSRFVQNYVSPLFSLLIFALVFSAHLHTVQLGDRNLTYLEFFLPGLMVLQTFQLFFITFAAVKVDRVSMVVPLIITAGARPIAYFASKLTMALALVTVQAGILTVAGAFVTTLHFSVSLPTVAAASTAFLFSSIVWFSAGFILGIFVHKEGIRDLIFSAVGLPLIFSSSIYYNIDLAPTVIRHIAAVNPLNLACIVLRGAWNGSPLHSWLTEFIILAALAGLSCVFALVSLKYLRL